jgi:hypothetical protein
MKQFAPFSDLDYFCLESRQFWKYEEFRFSLLDNHCTDLPEFFGDYFVYVMRSLLKLDEHDQVGSRQRCTLPKGCQILPSILR